MSSARNPLSALPSVLAIRDLRRRARRAVRTTDIRTVLGLLELDPPSVLRCLRAAAAPAYGAQREQWSIAAIAATLGPSLTRRALDVPTKDVAGTGPIRQLWLHAVATAIAARTLAHAAGTLDPDTAYLLGLLHDLPEWLRFLGMRQAGSPAPGHASEWLRRWDLPACIADPLARLAEPTDPAAAPAADPAVALIRAAELLAELADFWHPDGGGDASLRLAVLAGASREDLLTAQNLRHEVGQVLLQCRLDTGEPQTDLDQDPLEDLDLFPSRRHGDVSEVVLSILDCSKSASYRGIATATTAAALRFLDYDRALCIRWIRDQNQVVVRAKADLSARKVPQLVLTPSPAETTALQRALQEERPTRVEQGGADGLLRWIGADEALLAPLNREFATPSFLVLDRAITCRPILLLRDAEMASTLCHTTSLLVENLLLKRRRQRAQKFALTDPLTRLFNRTTGIKGLEQELARTSRNGEPLTVLMLDMDDFKKLNDRYGHLQGDAALRAMADVMRKTVRRSDTVCRYGGEEFLVVLPETDAEEGAVLAARVATAIEARGDQIGLPLTVSIGMAAARPDDTVETVLQRADQALYASKAQGRNRFSVDAEA